MRRPVVKVWRRSRREHSQWKETTLHYAAARLRPYWQHPLDLLERSRLLWTQDEFYAMLEPDIDPNRAKKNPEKMFPELAQLEQRRVFA